MKKITSFALTLLIIISSLSGLNVVVLAENNPVLTLGETVTVTDDDVSFAFTTQQSGRYVISTNGDTLLGAELIKPDGNYVDSKYGNAENGKDIYFSVVLAENTTYTLHIYNRTYGTVSTNYTLQVSNIPFDGELNPETEIKTDKEFSYHLFSPTVSGYYFIYTTGDEDTYGYLYDSNGDTLCSDDNMSLESNYRLEYYLNAGERYTVYTKVYSPSDNMDIGVCVAPFTPVKTIEEKEIHTVTDKWDILTFIPENSGTYRFYSLGEEDYETQYYGQIYNSDYEKISYVNEEMYSDSHFYVEAEMIAGETYYLDTTMLWYSDSSPENYNVTVCEVLPISKLTIVPTDGTVAGVNEDLHCELIIEPDVHRTEEITWYFEPERVGRIEYSGNWGASIELHSPGIAEVTAVSESGASASYTVTCEGELPELETNVTHNAYMEYTGEIHSYYFTAGEEGQYGILSRGDLDLKVAIYELDDIYPLKKETGKGEKDNFNLQFYNLEPGTKYIVEVTTDYAEDDYDDHSGNYEIMAYKCTDEVEGVKLSVGDTYTVYTEDTDYKFSASLIPETANQNALEFAVWSLTGDDIGYQTVYGRSFSSYRFYNAGNATLTVSVCDGEITDSCVITSKEIGYSDILLDEVKTVNASGHYSEGWFKFIPEEDGEYTFYSTGNADIDMYSNGNYCDYDSGYNYNFMYTIELSAGEEFFFECTPYSYKDQEKYYVSVCKAHYAESITIIEDPSNINEVNNYGMFSVKMGNGGAYYDRLDELIWSISDKSVAEFSWYYDDGSVELYFCGEGITTLTVTTPEGFSDSFDIYVGIEPPEEKSGDINGDGEINSLDLSEIRIVLLSGNLDYNNNIACDTNGDGEINIIDLIRLKRFLAGIDVPLGFENT